MIKGYLRAINIDDADLVLEWRNQDFVRNNMYNNNIIDYDTHIAWLQRILSNESCKYFIYEKNSIPMGVVGFYGINIENKTASWAFYLGSEKFRGAGVEMEQLALNYAFNDLGLRKLYCEVLSFNFPVVDFHRRFGFNIEGIRKQDYIRDGIYYDIYQLALLKNEYDDFIKSIEDKLPKTYLLESENNNLVAIMDAILNSHCNYPGRNYYLLDVCLKYHKDDIQPDLTNVKAKLIYQSRNRVKIEYFLLNDSCETSISEMLFERMNEN